MNNAEFIWNDKLPSSSRTYILFLFFLGKDIQVLDILFGGVHLQFLMFHLTLSQGKIYKAWQTLVFRKLTVLHFIDLGSHQTCGTSSLKYVFNSYLINPKKAFFFFKQKEANQLDSYMWQSWSKFTLFL